MCNCEEHALLRPDQLEFIENADFKLKMQNLTYTELSNHNFYINKMITKCYLEKKLQSKINLKIYNSGNIS